MKRHFAKPCKSQYRKRQEYKKCGTGRDRRKRYRQVDENKNRNKACNRSKKYYHYDSKKWNRKKFIEDMGSPNTITPPDKGIIKDNKILPKTKKYQDVNINKVKFAGKITVEAENRIEQHSQKQQKLNILPNIIERFSATEADTDLCGPNLKREVTHHLVMARKKKIPCCTSHKSPKRTPVKPVSGNLQYPYTFF